jgi:hypothetical protein
VNRSERISEKIAASQARLDRDSPGLPAPLLPKDAYPPESYRSLAGEYPWLAMAAGLGAGLLAGALMPKKAGGKFGKRALGLAMMAGEIGLALSKQAGVKAGDAGRDSLARTKDGASQLRTTARSAGATLAREAIKLAARARK